MSNQLSTDTTAALAYLLGQMKRDHGLRPALRRARNADDVIGIEAVHAFVERLDRTEADAALAILVAHPKVDSEGAPGRRGTSLAARLGGRSDRLLSPLRFSRLIHARDVATRLKLLRRALSLLGERLPPAVVSDGWRDLQTANGRRRFARAYFSGEDSSATTPNSNKPVANAVSEIKQ